MIMWWDSPFQGFIMNLKRWGLIYWTPFLNHLNLTPSMIGSESFFDVLKSKRESQNIEISEICEFTKIQPRYIEAIEQGDFTVLPNVYIRLFLKSYANFIGADSAKALKDYELHSTGKSTQNEELSYKDADVTHLSSTSIQDEVVLF